MEREVNNSTAVYPQAYSAIIRLLAFYDSIVPNAAVDIHKSLFEREMSRAKGMQKEGLCLWQPSVLPV